MHANFLIMETISLFYCCEKVFILINIWVIGKNRIQKKKTFYSHLNMENITETNFLHAKRICKDFEIKNEGEYRDLYVQSHTLLLTDVFENFRNMFLEIYGLGSFKISFSFWISIASNFKKTKVKWDLLTDIDMLLIVEKVSDAWPKPYIDMSTDLRKKQKMILKKIF